MKILAYIGKSNIDDITLRYDDYDDDKDFVFLFSRMKDWHLYI